MNIILWAVWMSYHFWCVCHTLIVVWKSYHFWYAQCKQWNHTFFGMNLTPPFLLCGKILLDWITLTVLASKWYIQPWHLTAVWLAHYIHMTYYKFTNFKGMQHTEIKLSAVVWKVAQPMLKQTPQNDNFLMCVLGVKRSSANVLVAWWWCLRWLHACAEHCLLFMKS